MCKVMLIAGIKSDKTELVEKLAKNMAKNMSKREEDGVGYAAITKTGKIYGEKWLNKDEAFIIHSQPKPDPLSEEMNNILGEIAEWKNPPQTSRPVYDKFGVRNKQAIADTVAVILHARKATTGLKVIENVHPFVSLSVQDEPDTALIHNGQIVNHDKLTKKTSTCDSEVLLHEYLGNQMYINPWGIENLAKTITGAYTVGVLSSFDYGQGLTPVLDIFKSNKELHCCYVPELETMVFSTDDTMLEESLKESDMTAKNMVKIKDGFFMRLNAVTGKRIDELIPFKTSAQWGSDYNRAHENSAVKSGDTPKNLIGPAASSREVSEEDIGVSEIDKAKTHFERRNPGIFLTPYVEKKELTQVEKDLFVELEKNGTTNQKALHLVKLALVAKG